MLNRSQGLAVRTLSDDTKAHLKTLRWPGNVRQLRNMVERILIMCDSSGPIEPDELIAMTEGAGGAQDVPLSSDLMAFPLRQARALFERQYLTNQINRFGGNISRTAVCVGMERSALHRKLKRLGLLASGHAESHLRHDDAGGDGSARTDGAKRG